MWWDAIKEVVVFAVGSLDAAAQDRTSLSKMVSPRVVSDDLGVLIPMFDCLAGWNDDLGFFAITSKTGFGLCWPMWRSVVGKRSIGLALTSQIRSLYQCRTGEVIGLDENMCMAVSVVGNVG